MHVTSRRDWAPDVGGAAVVLALGLWEAFTTPFPNDGTHDRYVVVACLLTVSVALCRHAPAVALTILVGIGVLHVEWGQPIMQVELAALVVIFATARWGQPATAVAGLFVTLATGVIGPAHEGWGLVYLTEHILPRRVMSALLESTAGDSMRYLIGVGALALLLAAWLAGLSLRFLARSQTSEASMVQAKEEAERAQHESSQAQEIARLRDEQARLARDVHDVVGHSLAVILAQAESAQYVDDADTGKLKSTMQTIADSARTSLRDVREVLSATRARPAAGPGRLDDLIEGVRASGHEVVTTEVGRPQPLPPELEVVAYRVLQEMLTNAMKHGRRDQPISVERNWPTGPAQTLRITVANAAADLAETQPIASAGQPGHGLDGMRRRLDSVGGHLDVRLEDRDGTAVMFTTSAWVPVRAMPR